MVLAMVHLVFHVSIFRKFFGDPNFVILLKDVSIEESLAYEEVRVEILDR